MRTITYLILLAALVASICAWQLSRDTREINDRIRKIKEEIAMINLEFKDLAKYKEGSCLSLSEFYPKVFNKIKEMCAYYNAACEVKLSTSKDLTNTEEFFRASQYQGIRYVDLLCAVSLREPLETYLLNMFYEIAKDNPIEMLDVKIEKNTVNLTMRLYGT